MSLRFCMLESVRGGQVAINPSFVVAVRADAGQTVVVHQGGELAVKGVVAEVVLKLVVTAGQAAAGSDLKTAA